MQRELITQPLFDFIQKTDPGPKNRKIVLPGFEYNWLLNGIKVPWYVVFFFLLLLLRSNGTKSISMRSLFVTVIVIIAKVLYWKLLDISSFQSSQQLTAPLTVGFERHLWRFYGHGSTYVLIYYWENIMNEKWAKVPQKLVVAQNSKLVLWRTMHHCTKTFHLFLYSFFFLWSKASF